MVFSLKSYIAKSMRFYICSMLHRGELTKRQIEQVFRAEAKWETPK